MNDIYQIWGDDIAQSSSGDLLVTEDPTIVGQQRVLRRLLTNPGEYIWHPTYGAGLRKMIGDPVSLNDIRGVVRSQILLEDAVARQPEPSITVEAIPGGATISIQYVDAAIRTPVVLSFEITP